MRNYIKDACEEIDAAIFSGEKEDDKVYESYERKPRALCPWMNRIINRDSSDPRCIF
jgi:hypothetical protein